MSGKTSKFKTVFKQILLGDCQDFRNVHFDNKRDSNDKTCSNNILDSVAGSSLNFDYDDTKDFCTGKACGRPERICQGKKHLLTDASQSLDNVYNCDDTYNFCKKNTSKTTKKQTNHDPMENFLVHSLVDAGPSLDKTYNCDDTYNFCKKITSGTAEKIINNEKKHLLVGANPSLDNTYNCDDTYSFCKKTLSRTSEERISHQKMNLSASLALDNRDIKTKVFYKKKGYKMSAKRRQQVKTVEEIDRILALSGSFDTTNEKVPFNVFDGSGVNPYHSEKRDSKIIAESSSAYCDMSYDSLNSLEHDFTRKCKMNSVALNASEKKKLSRIECSKQESIQVKPARQSIESSSLTVCKDEIFKALPLIKSNENSIVCTEVWDFDEYTGMFGIPPQHMSASVKRKLRQKRSSRASTNNM